MDKTLIFMFSDFSNSLQQASIVAPVVITSSINRMCLFLKIVLFQSYCMDADFDGLGSSSSCDNLLPSICVVLG